MTDDKRPVDLTSLAQAAIFRLTLEIEHLNRTNRVLSERVLELEAQIRNQDNPSMS
jgi:hypothetical protein